MSLARTIGRDIASALAVLVLVLLSIAPHSAGVSTGYGAITDFDAQSVCGDIGSDGAEHHVSCHACRASTVVLPASPCLIEPAYVSPATIVAPTLLDVDRSATIHSPHSPRAPPEIV